MNMDNLEKLIQMATIEHMYSMLQKMKNDTQTKEYNFSDKNDSNQNNDLVCSLLNEIKMLKTELNENIKRNNSEVQHLKETIGLLLGRTQQLENELSEIKNSTNNNSSYLYQQLRGQQVLTSYPGFSNGTRKEQKEEAHIKLKIEEKLSNEAVDDALEDEDDEDNDNPLLITCSTITLDVKPVVEEVCKDEPIAETSESEEEEESEEEVGTDDEKEDLGNVETQPPVSEEEQVLEEEEVLEEEQVEEEVEEEEQEEVEEEDEQEEVEEEEEQVEEEEEQEEDEELSVGEELGEHVEPSKTETHEEEEEEEVFEIEIDDVTYFATGEENGILYEMTADGDVGKKVGIIKDGEPIFN